MDMFKLYEDFVDSSWIDQIVLQNNNVDVTLVLLNGRRYLIKNVGPELFDQWVNAESKGKFFHYNIKHNHAISRLIGPSSTPIIPTTTKRNASVRQTMKSLPPKSGGEKIPHSKIVYINKLLKHADTLFGKEKNKQLSDIGDLIIRLAKKGLDVSTVKSKWLSSAREKDKFISDSTYRSISNMLTEYHISWNNLGVRFSLVESKGKKLYHITKSYI